MTDDEYDETALTRALTSPGSPVELSDEDDYRAMFRDTAGAPAVPPPRLAAVRRLSTGSALAVVFAVSGAGVAAAYTTNLPAPVQRVVHSALAPIGVPDVEPVQPEPVAERRAPARAPKASGRTRSPAPVELSPAPPAEPSATPDPASSTSPTDPVTPSSDPEASPSGPTSQAPPAPAPAPVGNPPASSAPPRPQPAAVSIAGGSHQVTPGQSLTVTGQVTAPDGIPVPGRKVVLQQRGPQGWQRLAVARAGADGAVGVSTGPLQRTTLVRLRTGKVHSAAWRIVLQPVLTVTTQTVDQASTLSVSAAGGQSGDQVLLLTRRNGKVVQVGRAVLTADGQTRFDLAAPQRNRTYVVRLPATAAHAAARAGVEVTRRSG